MVKKFKENFNFITNILILLTLVFGGLTYAVGFHIPDEIISGTFNNNYSFNEIITFNKGIKLKTNLNDCNSLNKGNLRYNNSLEICNGISWNNIKSFNEPCNNISNVKSVDLTGKIICDDNTIFYGASNFSYTSGGCHCATGCPAIIDLVKCETYTYLTAPGCGTYATISTATFKYEGIQFSGALVQSKADYLGSNPIICTW